MPKVTPEQREKIQQKSREIAQKGRGPVKFSEGLKPILRKEGVVTGRTYRGEDFVSTGQGAFVREERSGTPGVISLRGEIPTITVDELNRLVKDGLISLEDAKAARKALRRGRTKTPRKRRR